MDDTQAKFVRRCADLAPEELGIELVHDRGRGRFAGTGVLRWERADGFEPLMTLTYEFAPGYVRLGFDTDEVPVGRRSGRHHRTVAREDLGAVLDWITDRLAERLARNGRGRSRRG